MAETPTSDHQEITALVHSYARHLDAGDVDAVVALFEHSSWRSWPEGSNLHGSAAVRPVYEKLMARSSERRTKHLITNLSIVVDPGGSAASSHCYWTVLRGGPGERIEIDLSGQYSDTFERAASGWRFTDRLITVDLTSAAPAATTGTP
jgi:3-phenylpropionate/cinnamic acid dioxygenase small subunit